MTIKFKLTHKDARPPVKATEGAAGYDLTAVEVRQISDNVFEYDTGVILAIPKGFSGDIRARSSVSTRGLTLANGVGTVDSDYRGTVRLRFILQPGGKLYDVGERVGQLVIVKLAKEDLEEGDVDETARGADGFGSTNVD